MKAVPATPKPKTQNEKCEDDLKKHPDPECKKTCALKEKYCPKGKCPTKDEAIDLAKSTEAKKDMHWVCTEGKKCAEKYPANCAQVLSDIEAMPCKEIALWNKATFGGKCFPASALVTLSTGELEAIGNLRPGDRVSAPYLGGNGDAGLHSSQASRGFFADDFLAEMHERYPGHDNALLDFVEISHEHMQPGRPLRLTSAHLLPAWRRQDLDSPLIPHSSLGSASSKLAALSPAGVLRIGDTLLAAVQGDLLPSNITKIATVKSRGQFAPLTASGALLVEGVAVSSYALTRDDHEKVWDESPWLRAHVGQVWTLLAFPCRVLHFMGLPFMWMHEPIVHDMINNVLDVTWMVLKRFY
jgi:hypothetical protein